MLCKDIFVNYDGSTNPLRILFSMWRFEHDDPQRRKDYEEYYKSNHQEDYERFVAYEEKIIKRTPNIKQIYFDYLDGKRDHPEFKYFTPEGL